jgi:enoyl-CoA hydratase
MALETMTYAVDGRIARITLNRPERGNGLTLLTPRELTACVEQANLDPNIHVIALSGNGKGFCGGYDLVASAAWKKSARTAPRRRDRRSIRWSRPRTTFLVPPGIRWSTTR